MSSAGVDSPGVRLYPPLYFIAGLAAAWVAARLMPFSLLDPRAARALGLALIAAGIVPDAWGFVTFVRSGSDPRPDRPSKMLFTGGPFRFSRNPMYVGMTLVYCGIVVWTQWWWGVALLPGVLYALTRRVIRPEEAYMERTFGEDYREYCRRTRRWL